MVEGASKRKSANSGQDSQKRTKSYLQKKAGLAMTNMGLEIGTKGFYVTGLMGKENRSAKEVIFILDRYLQEMYPELTKSEKSFPEEVPEEKLVKKELSIEDSIKNELEEMKAPRRQSVFKAIFPDIKCISFIIAPENVDVAKITEKIMNDCAISRSKETRFTNRIIPIETTCKADFETILATAKQIGTEYIAESAEKSSFKVDVKIRNNQSLNKGDIINSIAAIFAKNHKIDLTNPGFVVLVEVFRGVSIVSILKNYAKLRKYNIVGLYSGGFLENKIKEERDSQ